MRLATVFVLLLALALPATAAADSGIADKLNGSWGVVKLIKDAKSTRWNPKTMVFTFKKSDWTWKAVLTSNGKSKTTAGTWTIKNDVVTTIARKGKLVTKMQVSFQYDKKDKTKLKTVTLHKLKTKERLVAKKVAK